jgi:hypothetical protein
MTGDGNEAQPRPRLLLALPAGALALVALFGLVFQLALPRAFPSDSEYRAAASALASARAPGDVVLLHPWWAERARLFLPPELPVVGYLGDTADDLIDHPRIWVLANQHFPRMPDADFRAHFLPDRTPLAPPRRFGPLTLTPYRNGRARQVLFSAVEGLERAEVSIRPAGGTPAPCTRSRTGLACPGGARAEVAWHEVLYQAVRCLFVIPPRGPSRLVIRFPDVPAAQELLLEAGITWEHAWKRERSDVRLQLSGPAGVLHLRIPAAHEGFVQGTAPQPSSGPLTVTVQTDDPHEREVCLRLRALGGAP